MSEAFVEWKRSEWNTTNSPSTAAVLRVASHTSSGSNKWVGESSATMAATVPIYRGATVADGLDPCAFVNRTVTPSMEFTSPLTEND